jgi:hypothetical protein
MRVQGGASISLILLSPSMLAIKHAPSADAQRHEMAQLDALEANFRVDFRDVNEVFPDDRT